jgi:peptide/nickel transport system substrate-binding protein
VLTHQNGHETQGRVLDPHISTRLAAQGFRLMYQGLLGYHPLTYREGPELAQKWEQPSQTDYIFTLESGVKWQNRPPVNGRELVAEDIVYSLNRARTNNPNFQSRSLLGDVTKLEAVDKSTIRISTSTPDASFLFKCAADGLTTMAREAVEKADKFATAQEVVGTGPYMITSVQENVGAEYVRNPDYWRAGKPYLDGMRTKHFGNDQLAFAAFLGGELDVSRVPGNDAKGYIDKQGKDYTPFWFPSDAVGAIQMNTKLGPTTDARVRRGLRMLIDHQEFLGGWAEIFSGKGRYGSILSTAFEAWDFTHEQYSNFLEWKQPKTDAIREGLSLLSAAGYTRDAPLKLEVTGQVNNRGDPSESAHVLLIDQYKRNSSGAVDPTYRILDAAAAQTVRNQKSYHYFVGGGTGGLIIDPDAVFTPTYYTGGSRNTTGLSDSRLDAMIDKHRAIFNFEERKKAVQEVITYMMQDGPVVHYAIDYYLSAVKPQVRNYLAEYYLQGQQYDDVWLDL